MVCAVNDCINNNDGYCEIDAYIRIDEYGMCDSLEVRMIDEDSES